VLLHTFKGFDLPTMEVAGEFLFEVGPSRYDHHLFIQQKLKRLGKVELAAVFHPTLGCVRYDE